MRINFWWSIGHLDKKVGVAELGEICRGNPPVVAPTADGVSTGALPLQIHLSFSNAKKKSCTKGRTHTSTLESAEADIVSIATVSTAGAIGETEETMDQA